jgi:hypothetical protein
LPSLQAVRPMNGRPHADIRPHPFARRKVDDVARRDTTRLTWASRAVPVAQEPDGGCRPSSNTSAVATSVGLTSRSVY